MTVRLRRSSGNIFRDLGFSEEEAENLKVRADLMIELAKFNAILDPYSVLISRDVLLGEHNTLYPNVVVHRSELIAAGAEDPETLAVQLTMVFDGASARAVVRAQKLAGAGVQMAAGLLDAVGVRDGVLAGQAR